MPTPFEEALAALSDADASFVRGAFAGWRAHVDLGQVASNVAAETALTLMSFSALLVAFAANLASAPEPRKAWLDACRAHKRNGRPLVHADCPTVLGRAAGLEAHAVGIANASVGTTHLSAKRARSLLLKHSGSSSLGSFESAVRRAPLGNYLVWATFNDEDPASDPFQRLPGTHSGICTALGLGSFSPSDWLIVLVWDHIASGAPTLHRPTVADAEDYAYYRPHPDPNGPWGLTQPLPPNSHRLARQPEVVFEETPSMGLILPFRVVRS